MLDTYDFVYAHIKNLKKKLKEAGCSHYIKTIYVFGYKWQNGNKNFYIKLLNYIYSYALKYSYQENIDETLKAKIDNLIQNADFSEEQYKVLNSLHQNITC
jgi:DNA-binding winged helix-turn-helix (wHTH) protein